MTYKFRYNDFIFEAKGYFEAEQIIAEKFNIGIDDIEFKKFERLMWVQCEAFNRECNEIQSLLGETEAWLKHGIYPKKWRIFPRDKENAPDYYTDHCKTRKEREALLKKFPID